MYSFYIFTVINAKYVTICLHIHSSRDTPKDSDYQLSRIYLIQQSFPNTSVGECV